MITEITETKTPVVGQVLCAEWGYEASYPEFYRVVKVVGEYVTLQELENERLGYGSIYDSISVTTNGKATQEKPFRRKFKVGNYGFYVRINSYKFAQAWDGSPRDQYNHH